MNGSAAVSVLGYFTAKNANLYCVTLVVTYVCGVMSVIGSVVLLNRDAKNVVMRYGPWSCAFVMKCDVMFIVNFISHCF